jgi:hypothetical protein
VAIAVDKVASAGLALVVLRMHLLAVDVEVLAKDRLLALGADVCGWVDHTLAQTEAIEAIGIFLELLVLLASQGATAATAAKVLDVVALPNARDELLLNWERAAAALGRKVVPVASVAVGVVLMLNVSALLELLPATLALEALGVELLA